jgi:hypothetical protein
MDDQTFVLSSVGLPAARRQRKPMEALRADLTPKRAPAHERGDELQCADATHALHGG